MKVILDPRLSALLQLRKKALKDRDPDALYRLGRIYYRMKGSKKQKKSYDKKAYQLFGTASYFGHAEATFMMGVCLENGIGVRQRVRDAIRRYRLAARLVTLDIDANLEPIKEELEELYAFVQDCPFCEEQEDKACAAPVSFDETAEEVRDLLCAAEEGDSEAQYMIGHNYCCGQSGFERDVKKGVYWLTKSAEQGLEEGAFNLAWFFNQAENYEEAAKWYRKYAELRIQQRKKDLGW